MYFKHKQGSDSKSHQGEKMEFRQKLSIFRFPERATNKALLISLILAFLIFGLSACSNKLEESYLQGQNKNNIETNENDSSQSPPPGPAPAPAPAPSPGSVEKESSPYLPDNLVLIEDTSDFTSETDNGISIHRFFQAINNGEPVFLYFYFDA